VRLVDLMVLIKTYIVILIKESRRD